MTSVLAYRTRNDLRLQFTTKNNSKYKLVSLTIVYFQTMFMTYSVSEAMIKHLHDNNQHLQYFQKHKHNAPPSVIAKW
jgi:hypothetical protein